jgi:hypothetical protein
MCQRLAVKTDEICGLKGLKQGKMRLFNHIGRCLYGLTRPLAQSSTQCLAFISCVRSIIRWPKTPDAMTVRNQYRGVDTVQ